MSIRKAFVLASVAVLGAAVVVLPTVALSETTPPSVVAENVNEETHHWRPPSVTIEPGGQVAFSNPGTEVPHGIHWISTPAGAPTCTAGVPVGTTAEHSGTNWSGTCTFAAAGTYTYYCTVHGAAMSGTVTVGTPTTTTTAPTGTGTTSSPTTSTPTGGPGSSGGITTPASAALSDLKLSSTHHGASVHGSLQIASVAAGGTLSVVLQAKLGGRRVQVGRLTRAYIAAGAQSWSIALSARARRALHAKHHLAVLVKVSLTPPGGTAVALTRTVTLHR
jgi:plastocyanin